MSEVYDRAGLLLSYTGPETDDVELAIEFAAEMKTPMMRYNDKGEWHFGEWGSKGETEGGGLWFGPNRVGPDRLAKMAAALYRFACRSYFRRAWVLQEIAVASNPTVKTGSQYDIGFDQIDTAMHHLIDMLRSDPSLAGNMFKADPTIKLVDTQELTFVRKLFYFRHLNTGGRHPLFGLTASQIRSGAPSFLEILVLARGFESSDPRDKIYALWNLARDKEGLDFHVDYQKSITQVYSDFARAWALQHGSLDVLGAVECRRPETELYRGAPSWVPDWSLQSASSCLVRRDRIPPRNMSYMRNLEGPLYWADGGGLSRDAFDSPLFTFEGEVLHCTGIILDTIHHIFSNPPEVADWQRFPHCDPTTCHAYHHWVSELCAHYAVNNVLTYESIKQAAAAMFHGDCIAVWPHRSQNPENANERWAREEEFVCRIDRHPWSPEPKSEPVPRHVQLYAASYDRTDAFDIIKSVTRGRRPFVSLGGYMGLMPSIVEDIEDVGQLSGKPWYLAIVATCSVPLLLQEQEDGRYKVCGSCFVQGWMEGEILSNTLGAETTRDFWAALAEGETLRLV
ncbi:hypothetical protein EJ03DRAFT_138513 [Teratosphaeria nubilosa]|uniref:Heterokaryon incompatibility domain-containing protein n=1 Tax=Teratosphaeria nubilosa TaxID=161662 RepID=A0A6G1L5X2_9PEZI|nr:hypothetical protein EJ03DRAFT_138513 [Teratosphaeria nubilosa]